MYRNTTAHGKRCRTLFYPLTVLFFVVLASAVQVQAREVTDMFGRKFNIANRPQKVYSASPPTTNLLYAIDPAMLVGLTVPIREHEKRYLRKEMQSLPILGGWYGQANTPNIEMILKAKPEIIIVQNFGSAFNSKVNEAILKVIPAPAMSVRLDTVQDYPAQLLSLGRLLGREARTKALAAYASKTIDSLKAFNAALQGKKKVSVYYAEGVDGLQTDCDTSMHAELINLAGGRNVHHCEVRDLYGMEKIPFEQLMIYNPDVILAFEGAFYKSVRSDPRWQTLRAVRENKVYLIPREPFNWFDRPPSFMRILGAKWLANLLYPEQYRVNIVQETQQFFKLFLDVNLTAEEAARLVQAR
jgi:iron complex transport system substrate-binding protein